MTAANGEEISAALRAQAAGRQAGPSGASHPQPAPAPRLPAWAVLALAVVLGAMAGGLAGIISTR